jgi:rhamnosyltransferase
LFPPLIEFYSKVKVFDNYKSTDSGLKLAFYILKQALKHFDIPVLFRWFPDMTSRYLGMKKGRKAGKKNG